MLYDAAHAFGVQDKTGSVLNHGDLSVLSFHATKVFNTFEGGAIICHSEGMQKKINLLKNFGIASETEVVEIGSNGKMSEINAAFGLVQLKHIDEAIAQRKALDACYRQALSQIKGIHCLPPSGQTASNYSYFPILVTDEYPLTRDELYQKLKDNNVFARRYFYPLISEFDMYKEMPSAAASNLPIASKATQQVLCLPIYAVLEEEQQEKIIKLIKDLK